MPLPKPPARKAAQLDASELGTPSLTRSSGNKASASSASVSSGAGASSGAAAPAAPAASSPRAAAGSSRTRGAKNTAGPATATPELQAAAAAAGADTVAAANLPSSASASAETSAAQEYPAQRGHHVTRPKSARSRKTKGGPAKLFVLDTNVLMHDPMSLFRFEEHDVYLPMITLEELDGHKKGMSEVARNARQVSRELDALATDGSLDPKAGIPLAKTGRREAGGKLYFQTTFVEYKLPAGLPQGKADNQILGVVQTLIEQQPGREVVLVSKDINMRVKARALGLAAEDYFNDKALEDGDLLYTGVMALPADFWERHGKTMESWQQGGVTYYRISGPLVPALMINQFVYLETPGNAPLYAKVAEITGKTAVLRTQKDYSHAKNAVWGVAARNREQNFALNLLMDPECDFITLTGTAGTGKTLLTLAAALAQVLDERRYSEVIVTRVTVPVGEDIGFLPGTEEEKMNPWMGALDDNLEVLARTDTTAGEWGRAATQELVRSKIKIKSMNFMRGRTFLNKFVIIDEAQNLTPKQMKTLITRAGPGTKIICL
ncbi:MAG: hypothetical protein RLZZ584_4634, partial [Pseudomonadota bacterium]